MKYEKISNREAVFFLEHALIDFHISDLFRAWEKGFPNYKKIDEPEKFCVFLREVLERLENKND